MRILVLNWQDLSNPRAGGAEIHLHEVFGRIARRGSPVTLLCSGWRGAPSSATRDGLEIVRVGGRHTYPLHVPHAARRLLSSASYDLVVEDLNKLPLYAPLWSPLPVVALVHHLFGGTAFRSATPPVAALTWLSERGVRRAYRRTPVQAVSASTREDLVRRGLDRERIEVVPNGVDTDHFAPDRTLAREATPTFLVLSRLQRYKRVDLAVSAIGRLRDRGVEACLWIAGRGPEEVRLRRLRDRLDLRDRVRFLGYLEEGEKVDRLRRAWAHVFTSPKEGWGITNLEAGACGTPSVASDSPGLRDSIRHRETGLLVPHGDVDALAAALATLAADPELRDRLGRGARRFAESHSWEATARRAFEHFERVVAEAPTARGG